MTNPATIAGFTGFQITHAAADINIRQDDEGKIWIDQEHDSILFGRDALPLIIDALQHIAKRQP